MKFLFTAPRFHTNQVPIVKGLIEKGHEVRYFVAFCGATEDHTYGNLVVIKPSCGTRKKSNKLSKTKTESQIESAMGGQFVPNHRDLKAKFAEYAPDVVICRDKTAFTLAVHEVCRKTNTPCILYDQEPLYRFDTVKTATAVALVQRRSIVQRAVHRIGRLMNKDARDNKKRMKKYGYPVVHITPVLTNNYEKYRSSGKMGAGAHDHYFPMVYECNMTATGKGEKPDGKTRILCVGKYREYKSHETLVEAVSLLDCRSKIHIDMYGQCRHTDEQQYFADLQRDITERQLDDCITLNKDISYQDMQVLFGKYDILVLPSRRETYGMVIVEAMANGLCVIASDGCGAAFCIGAADGGAIFPAGDAQKLADILRDLVTHPNKIDEKGERSHRYVQDNMAPDNYMTAMREILKQEFEWQME